MDGTEEVEAVKCTVLFFGKIAEDFGRKSLQIALERGTTIETLAERLMIAEHLSKGTKTALNGEFCDLGTEITDMSEVAFLPPVSGG